MASDCGSSCPADGGFYAYTPSAAGNAILAAAFGLLAAVVLFGGLRHRMPTITTALMSGLLLEILGFIGRILLRWNREDRLFLTLSLLGTLVGPSLTSGALFLIGLHILQIYGNRLTPIKTIVIDLSFYGLTISCIVQIVGCVSIAYGFRGLMPSKSAAIVAAGLGLQVAALSAFIIWYMRFIVGSKPQRKRLDLNHSLVNQSVNFSKFLRAWEIAAGTLVASSIYRVVEMASGISGTLFQNEMAFMMMNGVVPLISCALLFFIHLGPAFGNACDSRALAPAPVQHPHCDPAVDRHAIFLPPRAPPPAILARPFNYKQILYEDPKGRVPVTVDLVDREALW